MIRRTIALHVGSPGIAMQQPMAVIAVAAMSNSSDKPPPRRTAL
ncbi:MAG TPA: hypothetical protein VFE36_05675 [Candidatus Baltobacteraceae bacterium]|jgi:hypothetical protein|nr:hypothetical protein [Candidatus Baltobacteraceae bacterium]